MTKKHLFFLVLFCYAVLNSFAQIGKPIQVLRAVNNSFPSTFGNATSVNNNTLIIGDNYDCYGKDGNDSLRHSGSAYIFELDTNSKSWEMTEKITAPERHERSFFGETTAIADSFFAIGAVSEDYDENDSLFRSNAGAVYLYKKTQNGNWVFHQKLVAYDRDYVSYYRSQQFGTNLSINNNYLVVSIEGLRDMRSGNTIIIQPKVYVFKRNTDDFWEFIFEIDRNYAKESKLFLHDNTIFIGDEYIEYKSNGNSIAGAGAVLVYQMESDNAVFVDTIFASNPSRYYDFGKHVVFYDGLLAVGAPYFADSDNNYGKVYLFENKNSAWEEIAQIKGTSTGSNVDFGETIAINDNYLFIGSPHTSAGDQYSVGSVYGHKLPFNPGDNPDIVKSPHVKLFTQFSQALSATNDFLFVSADSMRILSAGSATIGKGFVYVYDIAYSNPETDIVSKPTNDIYVYPTITTECINVRNANGFRLTVFSIDGQMIDSQVLNSNFYTYPVKNNYKGTLILRMENGNKLFLQKIVVY